VVSARGVTEVCSHHGGGHGKPSWLNPEQESQVAAQEMTVAFTTAEYARLWICEQFGVTYSPKGINGLLHWARLRLKVPRPLRVKADLGAQICGEKGGMDRSRCYSGNDERQTVGLGR